MIHTGDKPYECNTCDEGFTTKQALNKHIMKHTHDTGDNMYVCSICDKGFPNKIGLSNHSKIHNNVHILSCIMCIFPSIVIRG
jgi:KRAB domain-containing zinc finger protein